MKAITIKKREQWRNWLIKNHEKEKKVSMVCYKKHTGIPSINLREAMYEAICFGWIDTTLKRLDDKRYQRIFVKRGPKANWSKNTLMYAKELLDQGLMYPQGIKAYKLGLKKKPLDHERDYKDPQVLLKELNKKINKTAKENYEKLSPSNKKMFNVWINNAKREQTIKNRVKFALKKLKKKQRLF